MENLFTPPPADLLRRYDAGERVDCKTSSRPHHERAGFWCPACGFALCAACTTGGFCRWCRGTVRSLGALSIGRLVSRK